MKRLLVICLILLPFISSMSKEAVEVSLSSEERELYDLLMLYRKKYNQPEIPLSPSLTYVAQCHVRDLQNHPPTGDCQLHSWSEDGAWTPICYPKNPSESDKKIIWNKPREMTKYSGAGYEIAYSNKSGATARDALIGWLSSPKHDAIILNMLDWKRVKWRAVGIGIYGNYAVIWFGEQEEKVHSKKK